MTTAVILLALVGLFISLVVAILTIRRRDETIDEMHGIQTAILRDHAAVVARTPIRGERGRFVSRQKPHVGRAVPAHWLEEDAQ